MDPTGDFPLHKSRYYAFYLLEREEIERLKWIESEKAGHDIGYDRAHFLWMFRHRHLWMESVKESGIYEKLVIKF